MAVFVLSSAFLRLLTCLGALIHPLRVPEFLKISGLKSIFADVQVSQSFLHIETFKVSLHP